MTRPLTIGAVAYDPKVVTIWEGFAAWLGAQGLPTDYVLYGNYERLVAGHLAGECDVAWNSPLAWLETERICRAQGKEAVAFAMRDTDRDLTSVIVVRADGPDTVEALRGKRVGTGAHDSPQGTLIPLVVLQRGGVAPEEVTVRAFDVMPGKHGDHVGGERDAAKALVAGEVDAACMIDANQLAFAREGTLPAGVRVLARSAPYDHCVFTAIRGHRDAGWARLGELLLSMRFEDPEVRPLLELEGLKVWKEGRTTGFEQLAAAIDGLSSLGAERVRTFIRDGGPR
ncbi:MAG: PhnD/SsuA/transferrin family substrate-binding protein [Myxococcota bacterium]